MIKLTKFKSTNLAEIFQAIEIKFAFVKKIENKYTQIHSEVKCRDFLGDCIWSKARGEKVSIWKFNYSFAKNPFDDDCLRLSIAFPDIETKDNFTNNYQKLVAKELEANTIQSVILETEDPLCIVLEADKAWQSNIWKISLYTFYIKLFSYKTIKYIQHPEISYTKVLTKDKEDKLLSKITTEFEESYGINMDAVHENSGFYSIITLRNKEMYNILIGK